VVAYLATSNTVHEGYQRTIMPNKNRKILSQMNHLMKMALGESSGVEIQARVSHTSTASKARIPRPDRSLLVLQPSPDCEFKGPLSNAMTAEEMRMKLDYEEQCYRQSESIARTRLDQLQKAVEEIPRPDRPWLEPQAPPDCAFKGPLSNPMTAEETRIKLDYEQRCYRHAEATTRTRLQQLQNSISDATKPTSRRKVKGKRHKYVRHPGSGNHRGTGHLHHSTHRAF
jgi:hypothetical protein